MALHVTHTAFTEHLIPHTPFSWAKCSTFARHLVAVDIDASKRGYSVNNIIKVWIISHTRLFPSNGDMGRNYHHYAAASRLFRHETAYRRAGFRHALRLNDIAMQDFSQLPWFTPHGWLVASHTPLDVECFIRLMPHAITAIRALQKFLGAIGCAFHTPHLRGRPIEMFSFRSSPTRFIILPAEGHCSPSRMAIDTRPSYGTAAGISLNFRQEDAHFVTHTGWAGLLVNISSRYFYT